MKLEELNKNFEYTSDSFDSYRIMKGPPYKGDCDDYAVTVLWIKTKSMTRFWWRLATFQSVIWFCKSYVDGDAHAVLWHRGSGYIDNITKKWYKETPHKKLFPLPFPIVMAKMIIGKVLR